MRAVHGAHWATPATGGGVAEDVLEPAALLLDPDERQAEVGDRVPDRVVQRLILERKQTRIPHPGES